MAYARRVLRSSLLALAVVSACADPPDDPPPRDPDDLDGDGVANAADSCPTRSNPDQHDEDGDGFGDVCDVCPTVADPAQADTSELDALQFADGIGDLCDPRPGRDGDTLAALHTFAGGSERWTGDGWTVADDRATSTPDAQWQARGTVRGGTLAIRAEIASAELQALTSRVAIVLEGDGRTSGLVCEVVGDVTGDGLEDLVARELSGLTRTTRLPRRVEAGVPFVLTALRFVDANQEGALRCEATYDGLRTQADIRTADPMVLGVYGVSTEAALAVLSAIAVYTSPPPCMPVPDSGPATPACPR